MRNLVRFAALMTIAWAAHASLPPLESKLQHELLAPCCYRETLDHHMSQEAYNMRAEIHQMLLSGDTERQIIDIYKARYGMRILAEPEGAYWWIATFTPPVVLASGVVALILLVRKWSRSSRAQTAS